VLARDQLGDAGPGVQLTGQLVDDDRAAADHVDPPGMHRSEHGPLVFAMEIRINTRLAEAPEAGQTIFEYDPRATGAEAYRLLADEYLLRVGVVERNGRPD